jgi:hypothetical protein
LYALRPALIPFPDCFARDAKNSRAMLYGLFLLCAAHES